MAFRVPVVMAFDAVRMFIVECEDENGPDTAEAAVARAISATGIDLSRYGDAIREIPFEGRAQFNGYSWTVEVWGRVEMRYDWEGVADDAEDAPREAINELDREDPKRLAAQVAPGLFDVLRQQGWRLPRSYPPAYASVSFEVVGDTVEFVHPEWDKVREDKPAGPRY